MKRTFSLVHSKIKTDRLVEGVRADVNKYLKRERKKTLPEGADFWDFDCKYGESPETAQEVHVSEIGKCISKAAEQGLGSFYIEIHSRAAAREKREEEDTVLDPRVLGAK